LEVTAACHAEGADSRPILEPFSIFKVNRYLTWS
jgi:hypothetical protein